MDDDDDFKDLSRKAVRQEDLDAILAKNQRIRKDLLEQIVALPSGPERQALEHRLARGDAFAEMSAAVMDFLSGADRLRQAAEKVILVCGDGAVRASVGDMLRVHMRLAENVLNLSR